MTPTDKPETDRVSAQDVVDLIDDIDTGIRQATLVTGGGQRGDKTLIAVEAGQLKTIRRALQSHGAANDMTLPVLPEGWFYETISSSTSRWSVRIGKSGSAANSQKLIYHDAFSYIGPRAAAQAAIDKINGT